MKNLTITVALIGALAIPAIAQDYQDEPGQGVARLSISTGDVTVRRGDSGEFIAGERNAPLVARDHVITGEDARAEIQLDWANMIRLAPDSEVRMGEIEDGNFFIQVVEGTTTFSVLRDSSSSVEISTPTVSVRPLERGTYRVVVTPDGSTEVTVRSGEAELYTARRTERLRSGRTMLVRGDPDDPELLAVATVPRDEWDRWNESRDRDLDRGDSYKYVSRDIYGADDLYGHGRWVYDSPYGWVWAPNVPATWAPYRAGRWVWVDYYGWTWVSSDPWGWAPYHYGRWYYGPRYGWVWYPGAVGPRHYWRPALVAFFGWGSRGVNINVSFGFGNVGWVPLAPYEVYRPWYGRNRSNVTINNITVVNNINIVNTYRNARFVNGRTGVTSISTRDFGRRPVTVNNVVRVTDRDLNRVGEVRGQTPFQPTRESRQFSDRPVNARTVAAARSNDRQPIRRSVESAGAGAGVERNRQNGGVDNNADVATREGGRGNARRGEEAPRIDNPSTRGAARTPATAEATPGIEQRRGQSGGVAGQRGNNSSGQSPTEQVNDRNNNNRAPSAIRRTDAGSRPNADTPAPRASTAPRTEAPSSGNQPPRQTRGATPERSNDLPSAAENRRRVATPESRPTPEIQREPAARGNPRSNDPSVAENPRRAGTPESRPTPEIQREPGVRGNPRSNDPSVAENRRRGAAPESRPAPEVRRAPEVRTTPRASDPSVAENRGRSQAPQARPAPEIRREPEVRATPRAMPSAPPSNERGVERNAPAPNVRRGGGEAAPQARPAPRTEPSRGGGEQPGARPNTGSPNVGSGNSAPSRQSAPSESSDDSRGRGRGRR